MGKIPLQASSTAFILLVKRKREDGGGVGPGPAARTTQGPEKKLY
jgi:hypothetical protein